MDRRIVRIGMGVVLLTTVAIGASALAKSSSSKSKTQTAQDAKASQSAQKVHWLQDLHAAQRASIASGRPMLIVVGGPKCYYCKKLDAEVFANPTVAKYINSAFVPVHLDYYKHTRVAQILEVKSLPTSVILSPEADLLGSIEGYVNLREYAVVLHQAVEYQRSMRDEKELAANEPR